MQTQPSDQYEFSPLQLWSQLERLLVASGQTGGTPQQWIGTIRNLQKKGVSALEIEWSNIIAALEESPFPVLHLNDVRAHLGDQPACELALQRRITDEYEPTVRYERQPRPAKWPPPIIVRQGRREMRMLYYLDRTFGICIWLHAEVDVGLLGRHRYWSVSVPRGRKKLAAPPAGRSIATVQEAMAYGQTLVARMAQRLKKQGFVGQVKSDNNFPRYVLPGGEHYTEWLITAPYLPVEYWGPHFNLPNIVAHVRTTQRATAQGARLLILEEIQSDWNQQLREAIQEARRRELIVDEHDEFIEWDDDMDPPPFNPYLNHWLDAALRMMLLLAADQGFAAIAWLPGRLHAERFPWANADGLTVFYDRIVPAAVEKLGKSWGASPVTAQFSTLSGRYDVRKAGGANWWLLDLETGQSVGDEFPNRREAEAFRRSKDTAALETVSALYISDRMRADIRKNGLPYLGAVGKRPGC